MSFNPSKPIALIYASTSGNVEAVMEKISELLEVKGFQNSLHRAEKMPVDVLNSHSQFIFGTSTWEHGVLNPYFQPLMAEMKKMSFAGKVAGFVGLGDTRYEPVLFCQGIEIVKEGWAQQGGQEEGRPLKINGEPYHQLDTLVPTWLNTLL